MKRSRLILLLLPAALLGAAAEAQTSRTAWGDPDLQGQWSNATLTPLQRPADLGDKEFFTEDEAKAYVRQRVAATRTSKRTGPGAMSGPTTTLGWIAATTSCPRDAPR
jgi:hypothetical protein